MTDLHKRVDDLKDTLESTSFPLREDCKHLIEGGVIRLEKRDIELILTLFKQWMDKYELTLISKSEMETIKIDTILAAKDLLSQFNPPPDIKSDTIMNKLGWKPLTTYVKTDANCPIIILRNKSYYTYGWWSILRKKWKCNVQITNESEWEFYLPC